MGFFPWVLYLYGLMFSIESTLQNSDTAFSLDLSDYEMLFSWKGEVGN